MNIRFEVSRKVFYFISFLFLDLHSQQNVTFEKNLFLGSQAEVGERREINGNEKPKEAKSKSTSNKSDKCNTHSTHVKESECGSHKNFKRSLEKLKKVSEKSHHRINSLTRN